MAPKRNNPGPQRVKYSLAAELRDALSNVGGLQLDIFLVVESLSHVQ